jgi:Beta-lactamase
MKLEHLILNWEKLARDVCVPGVAIAVLEGTKPIWSNAFGMANATSPVSRATIFKAASLRKQVVAFATLKPCKQVCSSLTHHWQNAFLKQISSLMLGTILQGNETIKNSSN